MTADDTREALAVALSGAAQVIHDMAQHIRAEHEATHGEAEARRDPRPVAAVDGEALDDLRAAWSEGVEEGPWFPAHRPGGPIVLDNKNGDSLFVSAEDATTLVNAFLQPAAIRGTEAGLDAARLARALDNLYVEKWPHVGVIPKMNTTVFGAYAEDIAAEYARLASAESEPS